MAAVELLEALADSGGRPGRAGLGEEMRWRDGEPGVPYSREPRRAGGGGVTVPCAESPVGAGTLNVGGIESTTGAGR